MARYLIQGAFTPEAWAAQLKNPQDRQQATQATLEKLSGRIECYYYAFGASEVIAVIDVPDNVSAAALAFTVNASGALKSINITPLMTVQEGLEAMRKGANLASIYPSPTAVASV